jgi:cytochrome c-type biogenesis protein CcmF
MEKRNALKIWTILLAILTFSLSLIGTFLVRSGVLTSVHAFATDPTRGRFILAILVIFVGGSLALFAWRAPVLKQGGLFAPISREGALVFNNLFLTTACGTVFVGTLYPLALEALFGEEYKISVGAPFFNLTFAPLFVPLLLAMPFGPLLAWKRGDIYGVAQRLMAAGGLGLLALAVVYAAEEGHASLAPFGIALAVFVMAGALTDLAERIGAFRMPLPVVRARALGLPRAAWGSVIAHFGIGLTLLGIVCETHWSAERIVALKPGQSVAIRHYQLTFDGIIPREGPNYREQAAKFTVHHHGEAIGTMLPAKRSFNARASTTTEAALMTRGLSQLYVSLGDAEADGSIAVRIYHKPLVLLIWLGAVVMALGGGLSLSDRRLRIGAPRPAAKSALAPAE